eukprot:428960-Rhodomonas_salina.1
MAHYIRWRLVDFGGRLKRFRGSAKSSVLTRRNVVPGAAGFGGGEARFGPQVQKAGAGAQE